MQQLTMGNIDQVSGGVTRLELNDALDIIGGIGAVCGAIPGIRRAAAFAGGVFLVGKDLITVCAKT
jgi:hypothetical protein